LDISHDLVNMTGTIQFIPWKSGNNTTTHSQDKLSLFIYKWVSHYEEKVKALALRSHHEITQILSNL